MRLAYTSYNVIQLFQDNRQSNGTIDLSQLCNSVHKDVTASKSVQRVTHPEVAGQLIGGRIRPERMGTDKESIWVGTWVGESPEY